MMKNLCFILLFVGFQYTFAQQTKTYTHTEEKLQNAIQLIDKQLFKSAQVLLIDYLKEPTITQEQEGTYNLLLTQIKLDDNSFIEGIKKFATKYPNTLHSLQLYQEAGDYYFEKGIYSKAVQYYQLIKTEKPSTEKAYETNFRLAYSYFALQKFDEAKPIFDYLASQDHQYTAAANYYSGYIAYKNNEITEAYNYLMKAKGDETYKQNIDKLLPIVIYKKGDYQAVILYCENILKEGTTLTPSQLLALGDSYYEEKEYLQAAKYLDQYAETKETPERQISYRLGYSLAQIGDNNKAKYYFSSVADGQDSLSQYAAYNAGISNVTLQKKDLAIESFYKAKEMQFDKVLQEKAALYYIKLCAEQKEFAKTIEGCRFFETQFPNSSSKAEVEAIEMDMYVKVGNSSKAMAYLEKNLANNPKNQTTYQQLTYNEAVEAMTNENYLQAKTLLHKSLAFPVNSAIANKSNFLLGEIFAQQEQYDSANYYYNRLTVNSLEQTEAIYGKAYLAYNQKKYSEAKGLFQQYSKKTTNTNQKADALARLADCEYADKNYENALKNYTESSQLQSTDLDYVYFQKGTILTIQEKYEDALHTFEVILQKYKTSAYYDKALFQKGNIIFEIATKLAAADVYTELIEQRPQSNMMPDALAKRAICYQLLNEPDAAIQDFRNILQNYPSSFAAEEAVQGLQAMNAKGYQIADYEALIAKFNQINPNSRAAVEGDYATAKSHYDNADYPKAINSLLSFVKKYPEHELTPDAYYFLGASYEQSNDYPNALFAYSKVKGNYTIRALQQAAEIELKRGNFSQSNSKYETMLQNENLAKKYEGSALAGLVQGYFAMKNYEKSQEFINQLYNKNHTKHWSLADLYVGKILLEKGKIEEAYKQLQKTVDATQDVYGAEAQYLIGASLRKQKKYEESTKALILVKTKYNAYQNWVYEAFLLIAENYIDLKNKSQAKATLQSIIDVSTDEKVKEKAKKRLGAITNE